MNFFNFFRNKKIKKDEALKIKEQGNYYFFHNDFEKAEECYQEALKKYPDFVEVYINLGNIYIKRGFYIEADLILNKAINIDASYWQIYYNLATLAKEQKNIKDHIKWCTYIVKNHPEYIEKTLWPEVHWQLSLLLIENENFDDALNLIQPIVSQFPERLEIQSVFGSILIKLGRYQEAIKQFESILLIVKNSTIISNIGYIYQKQGMWKEALKYYTKAWENDSENLLASQNLTFLLLLLGDYKKGWELHEKILPEMTWKDVKQIDAQLFRKIFSPDQYWHGENLSGKTLLIWTEQGLGDTLMMLRYIPIIKHQFFAKKIYILCEASLEKIVNKNSCVDKIFQKNRFDPLLIEYDYHCSTMSLPYLTNTLVDSIPKTFPYIHVSEENKIVWKERIVALPGLKIGLVWGGNKQLQDDKQRSIPLKKFAPLMQLQGITWISLQKGEPAEQLKELNLPIIDWTDELNDFQDTSALIEHLDLTICVDTSVIHLVGALGRPGWLLNRYGSEWRWFLECEHSPWYPSIRIFRQTKFADWKDVLDNIEIELQQLIKNENSI